MSITNLLNKIKDKTDIDKNTIMYLIIVFCVAIGSFGLGRLSIDKNYVKGSNDIRNNELILNTEEENNNIPKSILLNEKKYVASKNGKMYYNPECSGAKRIKPENEIWFSTSDEAEKSGYTLSITCKQ